MEGFFWFCLGGDRGEIARAFALSGSSHIIIIIIIIDHTLSSLKGK